MIKSFALFFFLLLVLFSIMSMNLFPFLRLSTFLNGYDDSFQTFAEAFLTMFSVTTPSNWFRIMHETARQMQPNSVCFPINDYYQYRELGLMGCGSSAG